VELSINSCNEAQLSRQSMEGTNAAVADATDTSRSFVMNVAGGEERLAAATEVGFVEAALNTSLAVVKPSS